MEKSVMEDMHLPGRQGDESSGQSDGELLERSRAGDEEATDLLLGRYKPLVLRLTRARFLSGGDHDDLVQEGMIGLLKAIRSFDPGRNVRFQTFAALCIDRQMLRAIEASNREKNRPLNDSVLLREEALLGVQGGEEQSPEAMLVDHDFLSWRMERLKKELSGFEKEVLKLYLDGLNYREIAEKLGKMPKTIDNAAQRIRRKCRNLRES